MWIYKKESKETRYSEYLIYLIGKQLLNFDMVVYELTEDGVRSKDFTENNVYNFEPFYSFVGDNEDYSNSFNMLNTISPKLAIDYLKMLYLDTLYSNYDRHNFNFGILCDADNGNVIKLAPNFDNNTALIFNRYPDVNKGVAFDDLFFNLLDNNKIARDMFLKINIPEITEKELKNINDLIDLDIDKELIEQFILSHQKIIFNRLAEYKITSDNTIANLSRNDDTDYRLIIKNAIDKTR